jgi:multimeric flavodoxin WrbA
MSEKLMKVLGIVGSPRRSGNTETLVDEVLRGAEEAEAVTEKVILNELKISPCQACNTCYKTKKCIQEDDMVDLVEKMQESTVWVLGTPIYWWGPTAQFKAFLDRWYGIDRTVFRGRKGILVIPLGGSEPYAKYTVGILTDVLNYLNIEHVATVLAPGGVRNHPQVMERAYNAGQKSVEK